MSPPIPGDRVAARPAVSARGVLIVDDSRLMQRVLAAAVERAPGLTVLGQAESAEAARALLERLDPDVVCLDLHLPGESGLALARWLARERGIPVLAVSSRLPDDPAGQAALLAAGVADILAKPDGVNLTLAAFQQELAARLTRIGTRPGSVRARPEPVRPALPPTAPSPRPEGPRPAPPDARSEAGLRDLPSRAEVTAPSAAGRGEAKGKVALLVIGASTGGIPALRRLLDQLTGPLPPTLIVQHLPEGYTHRLADRLALATGHDVGEGQDGEVLRAGMIRVAPGGRHMLVARQGSTLRTRLSDADLVSGHRPSIDVLFGSVAALGRATVAVVLTGMGRDGADGLLALRRAGAVTFGQTAASCVVYGMPKAAKELGAVQRELPPDLIGQAISLLLATPAA